MPCYLQMIYVSEFASTPHVLPSSTYGRLVIGLAREFADRNIIVGCESTVAHPSAKSLVRGPLEDRIECKGLSLLAESR